MDYEVYKGVEGIIKGNNISYAVYIQYNDYKENREILVSDRKKLSKLISNNWKYGTAYSIKVFPFHITENGIQELDNYTWNGVKSKLIKI